MADVSNMIREAADKLQSIYLQSYSPMPEAIRGVALIGPLCSGKTTLANTVRESQLSKTGRAVVPKRYATFIPSPEEVDGNVLPYRMFSEKVVEGEIGLFWERKIGDVIEVYGFEAPQNQNAFIIYDGNVALYECRENETVKSGLEGILFVGVWASYNVREERFYRRFQDLDINPQEVNYRLGEPMPGVPVVFRNYEGYESLAPQQIVTFVERLVQLNDLATNN